MFGQRKRLRRVAAHMVLVWLFALATGIVNACAVGPDLRPAGLSAAHDHQTTAGHPHQHAAGHVHQVPQADKTPCAKFCDDGAASPPTVAKQADLFTVVWLAPPPAASFAVQAVLEHAGAMRSEPGRPHARVPIPIAFLRLTL